MVQECGGFVKANLEMLCVSGSRDFLWKRTFKEGITCRPESLCHRCGEGGRKLDSNLGAEYRMNWIYHA